MAKYGKDLELCLNDENNGIKKLINDWSFNKAKIEYQEKVIDCLANKLSSIDVKFEDLIMIEKSKIIRELNKCRKYPLKLLIKVANIPESTFYSGAKRVSYLEKNEIMAKMVADIYNKRHGHIGRKKIKYYMEKENGLIVNLKKIKRLTEAMGIEYIKEKGKKYNSYMGDAKKTRTDLLGREFLAEKPLQKIATDVMMLKFSWGNVYFQCLYDLFNREILSYNVSQSEGVDNTLKMIEDLYSKYGDKIKGTIIHSDRGYQYLSKEYQELLRKYGINQSFSRLGNCLDNSIYESFNKHFKDQIYNGRENMYVSFEHFYFQVISEVYLYNNEYIRDCLGFKTPVQFRKEWEKEHL